MSELPDKCCGRCTWWNRNPPRLDCSIDDKRHCSFWRFKLPKVVPASFRYELAMMKPTDGTDCPCFERKENSDGEK